MPLRDHFHSPVDDRHSWDMLHGQWPAMIVLQLAKQLPPGFVAGPKIHLGGTAEVDVGALDLDHAFGSRPGGNGVALAVAEPTVSVEGDWMDFDEYEVQIYDQRRGRKLVAAIEIVSPANKDRSESRRAFVHKCAALLGHEVSVTIIDLVTKHHFNLYAELLGTMDRVDRTVAQPPSSIYAVACRSTEFRQRHLFQAWHRPLAIGQPLPSLPLWLSDQLHIEFDFEPSYEETCRILQIA